MSWRTKLVVVEISDVASLKYARHEAIRCALREEADVVFEDNDLQRHKVKYLDLLECVKEEPY